MRRYSHPLKKISLLSAAITAMATLGAAMTAPSVSFAADYAVETAPAVDDDARTIGGDDSAPADGRYRSVMRTRSGPPPSSFMAMGGPALPPVGFMEFCTRYPGECGRPEGAVQASMRRGRYDNFYWATAFQRGPSARRAPSALRIGAPAYGYAERPRFDWSLVFPVSTVGQTGAGAGPAPTMTEGLWDLLGDVNRQVNGAIREESDLASSGVSDHWDLPIADGRRVGDCEDFALEKRRALIARGIPETDLSLALVVTRWGESHAVLVVRTSAGDYVMDSLTAQVTPWRATGYRWVERQVPGDPGRWAKVG